MTDKKIFFCKSFRKTDICIINGIMDYIFYFLENVLAHSVFSQDTNDEVCLTLLITLFYWSVLTSSFNQNILNTQFFMHYSHKFFLINFSYLVSFSNLFDNLFHCSQLPSLGMSQRLSTQRGYISLSKTKSKWLICQNCVVRTRVQYMISDFCF